MGGLDLLYKPHLIVYLQEPFKNNALSQFRIKNNPTKGFLIQNGSKNTTHHQKMTYLKKFFTKRLRIVSPKTFWRFTLFLIIFRRNYTLAHFKFILEDFVCCKFHLSKVKFFPAKTIPKLHTYTSGTKMFSFNQSYMIVNRCNVQSEGLILTASKLILD